MLNSDVTRTDVLDTCGNRLKDGTRTQSIIIIVIVRLKGLLNVERTPGSFVTYYVTHICALC
jgi:hypothetical protein